jgi:hypothetical protein
MGDWPAEKRIAMAFAHGVAAASEYRVGDIYYGAWDDVDRYNINDTDERVAFVEGFLSVLPRVRCDANWRILDIVRFNKD